MSREIPVETSARHVHLSARDLETLFGKGAILSPARELSQPGQFLANERLTLVGPKAAVERVAVLGPLRENTQVEISRTDCFSLGVSAPVRESGDLENSGAIRLVGPAGVLDLSSGVIVAKRHLHCSFDEATELGVSNGEEVSVRINSPDRSTVFEKVVVRVRDDFRLTLHLDTDEANASGAVPGITGEIVR